MARLSPHFTLSEFACKDGTPYPVEWRETRLKRLVFTCELVRHELGDRPLIILSAFRTWPWHVRIYRDLGQPVPRNSYHLSGLAVDPKCPADMDVNAMHSILVRAVRNNTLGGVRGLKLYKWGAHLDLRPGKLWIDPIPRKFGVHPEEVEQR